MNAPITHDRRNFIGGSDVAAILGVSKWKSPFQLYMEKTGQYAEEVTQAKQRIFDRGHRWEPIVVEMLVDELQSRGHDVEIIARNERYQDPEFPFLACELDLELLVDGEEINGEMKTVHPFAAKDWGETETDEIPIYYAAQVMHGLMIKPRRRAIVAALVGTDDLRIHSITRDEETIAAIRARELEFWQRIQAGNPPEPTDPADIKWLYQCDGGTVMEADDALFAAYRDLCDYKTRAKNLEAHIELVATRIKSRMGNAARLIYRGETLATWKNNKESIATDWKSAYLDLGPTDEHKAKFTTTKPGTRPFILK